MSCRHTPSIQGAAAAPCTRDDPLLPAYRILLRIAREKRAQKETACAPPQAARPSSTTDAPLTSEATGHA